MATYYVRSTNGTSGAGTSWAAAFVTLKEAMEQATPPHTIYVSQAHAETQASALAITATGTLASPHNVICVNDGAEPPTAVADTATVTTTGASNITIAGSFYMYGVSIYCGSGSNTTVLTICNSGNRWQFYEKCNFHLPSTGASTLRLATLNGAEASRCIWKDCGVKFGAAGSYVRPQLILWDWDGGSLISGGTSPTNLVYNASTYVSVARLRNIDLSAAAAAVNIFECGSTSAFDASIVNSKLPASWSGNLLNSVAAPGIVVAMHNCDDGDQNFRSKYVEYGGSVETETTIYRTAGAVGGQYDGTTALTALSWKMTAVSNAEYPAIVLRSPEIVKYNDTLTEMTATVEFLINSATTLYTGDVWLEVDYLGTTGYPLGVRTSTRLALLAANTTECTTGTGVGNWTGDGAGAKSYKLVTAAFTPAERGYIHARVCLAKADAVIYVDPVLTLA